MSTAVARDKGLSSTTNIDGLPTANSAQTSPGFAKGLVAGGYTRLLERSSRSGYRRLNEQA
jgi:hypothetical protein